MTKISIIGAGGAIFTQNLIKDILLDKKLSDSVVSLMNINPVRLVNSYKILSKLAEKLGVVANFEKTTNLKDSLHSANYVLTIFRCGTAEHQRIEYEIPTNTV